MSEGSFWPKTWKEAIPLIVWGILIFAAGFEGIAALVHAEWLSSLASFILMVGLTAMLLHWKAWLASINPNWLVGAVIVALTVITFSPFVGQQEWPFSLEPVKILISAALLLVIGLVIGAAIFGRGIHGQIRQQRSHQELDYNMQQRKFILSNLDELLASHLIVMSMISEWPHRKCTSWSNELVCGIQLAAWDKATIWGVKKSGRERFRRHINRDNKQRHPSIIEGI